MKNYPVKTEARWKCETFDKFDQTSVDKCIEKQDDEFKKVCNHKFGHFKTF